MIEKTYLEYKDVLKTILTQGKNLQKLKTNEQKKFILCRKYVQ